jgi:hypothetical protein
VDCIDVFTRPTYKDCVIECLNFCVKNKGIILYSYVIIWAIIFISLYNQKTVNYPTWFEILKIIAKSILDKIQTQPESRREFRERFKLASENILAIKSPVLIW